MVCVVERINTPLSSVPVLCRVHIGVIGHQLRALTSQLLL